MVKKILLCTLLIAAVIGMAWAGGQADGSKEAEKVELSVLWFDDANESEVFLQTMADYRETHPNVSFDVQVIPFQDYEKKLKLMIAGGTPPDIARVTNNHIAMLYESMEPLNGNIENLDRFVSNFFESSLALATNPAGQLVALPTEATANGMLVNKTAFESVGIDIDELSRTWTWDEWVDAMKKVVAENAKIKYGIGYDFSPHRWSTLLFEAGGRFLNDELDGMNFNTPETLDTLNFFKMLHDEGLAPKSVWMGSEKPQEMFMSGLVACHIGGSWWINAYAQDITGFEWTAVRMPKRKIRSSVPGGKFIATFKGAANQEVAFDVIKTFSDKEHNEQYCLNTFNLSSRKDAEIEYPRRSSDFAVFADDLSVTPAYTANDWKSPELNKIYSYIREQIVEGLLGNQTVEETARNIHERGNSFFN
ncbi:sugar ABC transporter substrate-binding protein [Marispirochaeta sp.]|uniref:ABC transporter substrate-binding protein n=1 Tax=Marispirochaeta sp. TaxID=2038653 RepID=UPI0029C7C432|nr:sugar ABC transporter substrate-binding protein [Marispirochaeta sp.]